MKASQDLPCHTVVVMEAGTLDAPHWHIVFLGLMMFCLHKKLKGMFGMMFLRFYGESRGRVQRHANVPSLQLQL